MFVKSIEVSNIRLLRTRQATKHEKNQYMELLK